MPVNENEKSSPASLSIPKIWESNVKSWFTHIELAFEHWSISDQKTKFFLLVSSLNEDILKRVKFEEFKPQSDDSYTLLKVALLKNLQPQNKEKVGRLVSLLYSEAKRLSINETLCRMEYLLPHNYNPRVDLIRYAILQATPASLRNELLTKFDIPLHEFIKLAKFIEMDNITPLGFHGGLSMIPRDCYFHKVFGDDARKCETPDKCPPLTIYFKEESE